MTLLAFPSLQTIFDVNGSPVRGAKAYFYSEGTLAPIQVHKVSTLDSAYTQPVPVSGLGRFPPIFTNAASYRVRILDSYGSILEDIDGISGTTDSGGGGGGVVGVSDQNSLLVTGDILFNLQTGTRAGFVRANGRTISSATGGGTERANADVQSLFLYLWAAVPTLAVAGGRGASAAADWAANKALDLPDLRGRGLLGADAMGSTVAGRLTGGLISAGSADAVGSVGGTAAETAPLPAHTHGVGTLATSNITPTHSGTTSTDGSHSHNYSAPLTGQVGAAAGGIVQTTSQTLSTTPNGSHSHTLNITGGSHNHPITGATATQGPGGTHNNLSPFMVGTFYIRL